MSHVRQKVSQKISNCPVPAIALLRQLFVEYIIIEVPGNLTLNHVGARRWISRIMLAIQMAGLLGGLVSALLLSLDGIGGLAGWRWLFLIVALPVIGLAAVVWQRLPNPSPAGTQVARCVATGPCCCKPGFGQR